MKTVCSACELGCGVIVHVKDGHVVRITGDRSHPVNSGRLCIRGMAGIELLYHPERLNHPLIRTGERGEGAWERISWDDALDRIAEQLSAIIERDGPESVCLSTGSNFYEHMGLVGSIAARLGTPNVLAWEYHSRRPAAIAALATIGYAHAILASAVSYDEIPASRCVMLWGDTLKSDVPFLLGPKIREMQEKGGSLIVVDPRPTDAARNADIWLQIRPGTDDALALGMLNIIIAEELYDRSFVTTWTDGFEALARHVKDYPPAHAAGICSVRAGDIADAAWTFATSRPSCICQRDPLNQSANPVQTSRAILLLDVLCGNLDVPGGNLLPHAGLVVSEETLFDETSRLPKEVRARRIGAQELPLLSGPTAVCGMVNPTIWAGTVLSADTPPRALISTGCVHLPEAPSSRLFKRALGALEFSVAMDQFMNPAAELADIVLPASGWLEKDGIRGHYDYPYVVPLQHRAVDPLHERRDEAWFLLELAKRLGLPIPWDGPRDYADARLKPSGQQFSGLEGCNYLKLAKEYYRPEKGTFRFKTASGRIELSSSLLERYGYDPLPVHQSPPPTSTHFPLVMIWSGSEAEYVRGTDNQIRISRKKLSEPFIEMSPETAESFGIDRSGWVTVETRSDDRLMRFVCRARIVEGFLKDVVAVDHGWWLSGSESPDPALPGGAPDDLRSAVDPVFGGSARRSLPCRIFSL